ncbi:MULTISPECIES: hypothetical protein [Streptomyces]|nr:MULTISPECIES: hypothetical protein [Streptomyces]
MPGKREGKIGKGVVMRTAVRRTGLAAAVLIAALGLGSSVAAAAPTPASNSATTVAAADVSASTPVYMGRFESNYCVTLMLWYNSQGYIASCQAVTSTLSDLYVYV